MRETRQNTINAFNSSLEAGADEVELDVQLSKDEVVMLYHPRDLSVLTNGKGNINDYSLAELKQLDAAYNFDPQNDKSFPQRAKGYKIATLAEAIDALPNQEIIVDLKSLPANKLIDAIIKLINLKNIWSRLIFYSTNEEHLQYLKQQKPEAKLFENRSKTRQRLLTLRNENICCCQNNNSEYIGFELGRFMLVEEEFALGKSVNKIYFKLWDKNAVECTKNSSSQQVKIFLFGINSQESYKQAKQLNAYAIFTDEPEALIKAINSKLLN